MREVKFTLHIEEPLMKLSQCYINWEAEFTNSALGFEITVSGMPRVKKAILHLLPEA